ALNFASALATAGHHVILIEADVRRPSLAATLRVRPAHGIAGVLMGEIELKDALIAVDGPEGRIEGLLAEQAGPYLADGRGAPGRGLVGRATALAAFLVGAAPPVPGVSDALPPSQQGDDVLIVARLGHSRVDQLTNLGEILARQGVRPAGLV